MEKYNKNENKLTDSVLIYFLISELFMLECSLNSYTPMIESLLLGSNTLMLSIQVERIYLMKEKYEIVTLIYYMYTSIIC